MVEQFEFKQGNDCDISLKDCRIEVRSRIESDDTIRLNLEIFDKNDTIMAKIQRFIGRK